MRCTSMIWDWGSLLTIRKTFISLFSVWERMIMMAKIHSLSHWIVLITCPYLEFFFQDIFFFFFYNDFQDIFKHNDTVSLSKDLVYNWVCISTHFIVGIMITAFICYWKMLNIWRIFMHFAVSSLPFHVYAWLPSSSP